MRNENGFFLWNKGEYHQFNQYFTSTEFEDRHAPKGSPQKISEELIYKLTTIRTAINKPITPTSGFRTKETQEFLRLRGYETSVGKSPHEDGIAADIVINGPHSILMELYELCKKEFKAVGLASNFIHVDMRKDKERLWYYKKV